MRYLLVLIFLLPTSLAFADVPNEPCQGLSLGDACETLMGEAGTCVDDGGILACEPTDETVATSGGGDAKSDDGGCSVGRGAGASGWLLVAMAGLWAWRRRR